MVGKFGFVKNCTFFVLTISMASFLSSCTTVGSAVTAPWKKDLNIVGQTRDKIYESFGKPFAVQPTAENASKELFEFYMGQDARDRVMNVAAGVIGAGLTFGLCAIADIAKGSEKERWYPNTIEIIFDNNGLVSSYSLLNQKKMTHEIACQRGYGASCFEIKQYAKGCNFNHIASCERVVVTYELQCGGKKDVQACRKAVEILTNKLNQKDRAKIYADQIRVDVAKKTTLPCTTGDSNKCLQVARQYWNGTYWDGIEHVKSKEKAATYFQFACKYGSGIGCFNLANIKAEAKQTAEARTFYQKACNNRVADGCIVLAEEKYENKDFTSARTYYEKACKLGSKEGCTESNSLKNQGF